MGELRQIPYEVEVLPDTFGCLVKLKGEDHEALAVYFPSQNKWDITCSCNDPSVKGGKSRWYVTGAEQKLVEDRFMAHLSYFNRPKTRID